MEEVVPLLADVSKLKEFISETCYVKKGQRKELPGIRFDCPKVRRGAKTCQKNRNEQPISFLHACGLSPVCLFRGRWLRLYHHAPTLGNLKFKDVSKRCNGEIRKLHTYLRFQAFQFGVPRVHVQRCRCVDAVNYLHPIDFERIIDLVLIRKLITIQGKMYFPY